MQHSPKFEIVKEYYNRKFWDLIRVRNAVLRDWITPEEYKEITGKEYK